MPEASVLHKTITTFEDATDFLAQNNGGMRFWRGKHELLGSFGRFIEVSIDAPEHGRFGRIDFVTDASLQIDSWNFSAEHAIHGAEILRRELLAAIEAATAAMKG